MHQLIKEVSECLHRCWSMGWNEANGGNLSLRIDREKYSDDIKELTDNKDIRVIELSQAAPSLAGEYFIVTGRGQYFRKALDYPSQVLGVVQISEKGDSYRILWGFEEGGQATSEFPTHLAAHDMRIKQSKGEERLILHCHPPELIALSFILPLGLSKQSKKLR